MNDELTTILDQSIQIFIERIDNRTKIADLATKYNLSERTIQNRIATAREFYAKELELAGDKLRADLWRKYEKLADELETRWQSSGDVNFAAQLRGVYGDMRKMISLDKPTKAPVNEEGKATPTNFIIVMDDAGYKEKERQFLEKQSKIIEGDYTENST